MQEYYTEISKLIKERISRFNIEKEILVEGTIISIKDGIIKIFGLTLVKKGEMIKLPDNNFAIALNLEKDLVGAVVMGSYLNLKEGDKVYCTKKVLEVPVGYNLLGRILNSLGKPIDGKETIKYEDFSEVEKIAPGVIDRESISEPMYTGYKAIDSMIPIGKGQRELIIGDRQTGKSSLAIDTIINQKNSGIKCIYVAIGQKLSSIVHMTYKLQEHDALKNTVVIVASAAEPAIMQYIAPYTGCTIGEYFRDLGEDALVVYDDLSKHAVAYRQISLLLNRPPGREAYPGDIFYLHSRLLERASRVNKLYVSKCTLGKIKKSGSLTALPIIETQAGDISSFIPTNVISITDGQIFLESELFNSGVRPAIDPKVSVSRVGSAAQTKIMKALSGGIRTSLAQYYELESFSKLSSDLDKNTKAQLDHGKKIIELLKQKQYHLFPLHNQIISIFAVTKGYLKDIKLENVKKFEKSLIEYFNEKYHDLIKIINDNCEYSKDVENKFHKVLNSFKKINLSN